MSPLANHQPVNRPLNVPIPTLGEPSGLYRTPKMGHARVHVLQQPQHAASHVPCSLTHSRACFLLSSLSGPCVPAWCTSWPTFSHSHNECSYGITQIKGHHQWISSQYCRFASAFQMPSPCPVQWRLWISWMLLASRAGRATLRASDAAN
jgi:hypothetical protein